MILVVLSCIIGLIITSMCSFGTLWVIDMASGLMKEVVKGLKVI